MDERTVSKARMSLATSGCPRIRAPSSNALRGKMAALYSSCSSHRVRTLSSVRSGPAQCRRWASADLSRGPAYKSRPGLSSRQGPSRGAELRRRIDNVSSHEVSTDGGSTARRRPNLSITSPQESITGSRCRQPLLHSLASKTRALF